MTPEIYVLARPSFTDEFSRFLAAEKETWIQTPCTPAEKLIEFAGRICYMSFGSRQSVRTNREYIQNLIDQGHESVLEHLNWTFLLTGVTRAFTHQLVRHRAGLSFSQLSQQYHDETEAAFVVPEGLEHEPEALAAWKESIEVSRRAYKKIMTTLLRGGRAAKETKRAIHSIARSVLPNATETKIVVTANARAIRHFLSIRGAIEGDIEMRRVSKLIYDAIVADAPAVVSDFVCEDRNDGTPVIRRSSTGWMR
jgi:thymidylate synthase (FAD)